MRQLSTGRRRPGLRPLRRRAAMSPMNTVDAELLAARARLLRSGAHAGPGADSHPTASHRRSREGGRAHRPRARRRRHSRRRPRRRSGTYSRRASHLPGRHAPLRATDGPGAEQVHLVVAAGDNSQPWDTRFSMQTGISCTRRPRLSRCSRSPRRWRVSCAATSRTTLRSSLLTQHSMTSGSRPSRSAACCAAPARSGRSHDSIARVTGSRLPLETLARMDLEVAQV